MKSYYFKNLTKDAQNLAIKNLFKEILLKLNKWEQLSTQINIRLQQYLQINNITMIENLQHKHYQYYLDIHTINDIRIKPTQVYINLEQHLERQEKSNYLLLKKYSSYFKPDIFIGYGGQEGVEDLNFGSEHFNTKISNKNEIYLEFLREANIDIGKYEVISYFENNDNDIELRVNQVCDQFEKGIREQLIALVDTIETEIREIVIKELNNEKYIKLVYSMLLKDTCYVFDDLGNTIN